MYNHYCTALYTAVCSAVPLYIYHHTYHYTYHYTYTYTRVQSHTTTYIVYTRKELIPDRTCDAHLNPNLNPHISSDGYRSVATG